MSASISLTVSETSTSPANNTSVVKAVLKITTSGATYNEYSPSGYIIIDGTKYKFSHGFSRNTTTTLATKSKTVTHAADGSKTVTVKASFSTGVSAGTLTKTVTKKLTTFTRSYTVSYNANGGSGAPTSQTKNYGSALVLSKTLPTRTGYTFLGWSTNSGAKAADAAYTAAKMKAGVSYTANAALTLYAVWQVLTYTVSYNANGGSGAPASQTKTYGTALALSKTLPSRTGYTFLGWSTNKNATVADSAYTIDKMKAGVSYTANTALTLYAIWRIITYTITYNANGGSGAPNPQTKNHGATINLSSTIPTYPVAGYRFLGWSTNKTATTASWVAGASFSSNANTTLYAVWANTYIAPSISNRVVYRCVYDSISETYKESLSGENVYLSFNWTAGSNSSGVHATTIIIKKNGVQVD